jgi:hypothetical protein
LFLEEISSVMDKFSTKIQRVEITILALTYSAELRSSGKLRPAISDLIEISSGNREQATLPDKMAAFGVSSGKGVVRLFMLTLRWKGGLKRCVASNLSVP